MTQRQHKKRTTARVVHEIGVWKAFAAAFKGTPLGGVLLTEWQAHRLKKAIQQSKGEA